MQIYDIIDELPRGEGKIIYNGSTQKYGYHYHWIYKPSTEGGSGVVKDAYNSQEEVRVAYCEHRKSWMADAAMRHRRNQIGGGEIHHQNGGYRRVEEVVQKATNIFIKFY